MTRQEAIDAFIRRANERAHLWGRRVNRGLRLCDRIATKARAAEHLPLTAYVSSDGKRIEAWPGTPYGTARLVSERHWPGRDSMSYYRATVYGREYYGRNLGPGMVINLYPKRGKR